jgi:hypothetical protein
MSEFVIAPHMRLHEWVAEEKGYFAAEGLDYEFRDELISDDGKRHDLGDRVGAYQTFERGRSCDVSSACHWTVDVAASSGHGKLYPECYSVSPCGLFVHPDAGITRPQDLAGVPISVGYQSGSHYSTIQALEPYLDSEDIKLSFADGLLFRRMEKFIDAEVPAVSAFSGPFYFLEQLGYRKVVDTTFMMATIISGSPDPGDVRKYFRALRRAQVDIDLRPELYVRLYLKEFPERFHDQIDLSKWGPGERLVFERYTREMFEESFEWIAARDIFPDGNMGAGSYQEAVYAVVE